MRMMTALAVGSLVVLTGCATRKLSSSSLPPPRVVTRKAPAAAPATVQPTVTRRTTTAATVPTPPSVELFRGQRTGTASSTDRVVPVGRTGRVQPAVAAPAVRTNAPAPVAEPLVAPPVRTRSAPPAPTHTRSASPCDVRSLFTPTKPCTPIPVNACPGGT